MREGCDEHVYVLNAPGTINPHAALCELQCGGWTHSITGFTSCVSHTHTHTRSPGAGKFQSHNASKSDYDLMTLIFLMCQVQLQACLLCKRAKMCLIPRWRINILCKINIYKNTGMAVIQGIAMITSKKLIHHFQRR